MQKIEASMWLHGHATYTNHSYSMQQVGSAYEMRIIVT